MKTITLKTDDIFFEKVSDLAKHLHLSKSELIRRAVAEYEEVMQRKEMKEQMRKASLRVRQSNRSINDAFDTTLADGLDNV
ncbi:MAG TPA: ribbon-helix-helix protein, CopG family [Epsilonproteobacteria bacterium]|nr:ribbon-helix-helix protein, CopG family [Campylobacterota bacterium]